MFEISGTQITLTRGDSFTGVFPMYVDGELYEIAHDVEGKEVDYIDVYPTPG